MYFVRWDAVYSCFVLGLDDAPSYAVILDAETLHMS